MAVWFRGETIDDVVERQGWRRAPEGRGVVQHLTLDLLTRDAAGEYWLYQYFQRADVGEAADDVHGRALELAVAQARLAQALAEAPALQTETLVALGRVAIREVVARERMTVRDGYHKTQRGGVMEADLSSGRHRAARGERR